MRFDARVVQVVIAEAQNVPSDFWKRRDELLDLLRPNRSFAADADQMIYRRWMPGGDLFYGNDLETLANSALVTSATGRFVHYGVKRGSKFFITSPANHGEYTVLQVLNDYTVRLNADMKATGTDGNFVYRRSWSFRDLHCLLESGPNFDQGEGPAPFRPMGYKEVLRLVAHDPMWYGEEQEQDWNLLLSAGNYGDLVFDDLGAWFGAVEGAGRWVFLPGVVAGETGTADVHYWGTAPAYPIIYVDGPAENFRITNETVNESIATNYDVATGETLIINVLSQSVTNNLGENLTHYAAGDLATFGLYPPPHVASDRRNAVSVSFGGATPGTSNVRMVWQNRYVGI